MHLQILADDAPLAPELPALPESVLSVLHWALWGGMVLCIGWIFFQVTRFAAANSQGRAQPGDLVRIVPGVVGLAVLGAGKLAASSLLPEDVSESQDTPAIVPADPAPDVPAAPAPDEPMNWTPFIAVGVIIVALIGLALLGLIALRARHQIVDRKAAAADREKDWNAARAIFDQTRGKFADYLADPYAIFERPLLDDHSDRFTAAFLTALADAEGLHTESVPRSADRIDEFRSAATVLASAWAAADRHARSVGMGVLSRRERKTLETIQRALAIALDEGALVGEREAAMRTVTRLSGELPVTVNTDRIVQNLTLSLENAQRKALTV
ncbi:hypothetical protein AC1659_29190 [Rhodococcus erythropolis]|uniref:hypothetical protein n=1 Tax=Rhodococcus erythropolis TaxID=1833 RepID=UPI001BACF695|nr:hypothetical protein [Rhodococcus erythropolis]MBS2993379.1 hypothetical protein [Rhodococcus erythropolis]